jgi:hypothetical protein
MPALSSLVAEDRRGLVIAAACGLGRLMKIYVLSHSEEGNFGFEKEEKLRSLSLWAGANSQRCNDLVRLGAVVASTGGGVGRDVDSP